VESVLRGIVGNPSGSEGPMFRVLNGFNKHFCKRRFVIAFGAYGNVVFLVYAPHLEDALDECIDHIADPKNHLTGLLSDEHVNHEYKLLIAEGKDEETAYTEATVDTISGGNCGNYLNNWEVNLLVENPDRRTLKEIVERFDNHHGCEC
jgi:hypothetical protein